MAYAIRIIPVQRLDCRVEDFTWQFATENASRVDAHWRGLCQAQPALFNGRVLLMHGWGVEHGADGGDIFQSRHFETDFKSFIGWRDFGFADPAVRNCFSMAALRSADGAYILGIMGEHTANAGQIYFPAGTPDANDVVGDVLDLERSALRELLEETGLAAGSLEVAPDWSIADAGPRLGCMKSVIARAKAAELCEQIGKTLAAQEKPELCGLHVVRTRADIDRARMPDFMVAWLEAMLP